MSDEPAAGSRIGERPRESLALVLGWLAAGVLYLAAAAWLSMHPAVLPSDDALFFSRGLVRFSILDLSPQFPGYPGFVAMGRVMMVLTDNAVTSLFLTTLGIACLLPPAAALAVWRMGGGGWPALAAFILVLAGPLWPDLGLSLLSDGSAILFLLLFVAMLPRERARWPWQYAAVAGAMLAWAGACRPSDAVLLATAGATAMLAIPRRIPAMIFGALLVLVPVTLFLWAHEGSLYLGEGLRFVEGHAQIWGNTPFAGNGTKGNWLTTLAGLPFGIPLVLVLLAGMGTAVARMQSAPPALVVLLASIAAHAVWIVAFQNPDNLRHMAPLFVLGAVVVAHNLTSPARLGTALAMACFAIEAACLAATVDPRLSLPPMARARAVLADLPAGAALATNRGVFLLRRDLPDLHVYDLHYPADAALGLAVAEGSVFRLSGTALPGAVAEAVFPARFAGEHALWLYRLGTED